VTRQIEISLEEVSLSNTFQGVMKHRLCLLCIGSFKSFTVVNRQITHQLNKKTQRRRTLIHIDFAKNGFVKF
jgi:hypothetical protein